MRITRAIDAGDLVIKLSKMMSYNVSPMYHRCYEDTLKTIAEAPTIDVRPVVHGRWIYDTPEHEFRIDGRNKFRCSNCGEVTDDTCMGRPRANFCQICGADMREENNDNNDPD